MQNSLSFRDRYFQRISMFDSNLKKLLTGNNDVHTYNQFLTNFDTFEGFDKGNNLLYFDSITYLPNEILHLTDRMSMATSLEARTPFLDYRLVQFAAGIPSNLKFNGKNRTWKLIMKEALKKHLPSSIITRPKWGFGAPVKHWMADGLKLNLDRIVSDGSMLEKSGLFDGYQLKKYLNKVDSNEYYRRDQRLWALLVLEVWLQVFIQGKGRKPSNKLNN